MALTVRVFRMLARRLRMFRRLLGVGFSHLVVALAVMLRSLTMALGGALVSAPHPLPHWAKDAARGAKIVRPQKASAC